ncbi:DUF3426 domain-containing protein [Paraburkholderia sp. SUR17]|uniref:DUF3426 domain-containing protein n=1 Tax=Paraburkholderia sp. SUR17 TaxID=3034358 RepID=UPI002407E6A1|nr:DUF3426 domain-containing protein [Paraburkholderia sp. SUR17]WEY38323.1 DUF3426 domain-containing protein [Paraburkholderia sp. SUR17]
MFLVTRCPFCEAVFRIQPAQLAPRRGLVRCGHCQEVFDASSSLFELPAGSDFSAAVPVPADVASALAAHGGAGQTGQVQEHAVTAEEQSKPPVAEEAPAEARSAEEPAAEAPSAEVQASEEVLRDEEGPAERALGGAEPSEASSVEPPSAETTSTEPPSDVSTEEAAAASPVHDPHAPPFASPPNFRSRAWDPWSPPHDANENIGPRFHAGNLPLSHPAAAAAPPATLAGVPPPDVEPPETPAEENADAVIHSAHTPESLEPEPAWQPPPDEGPRDATEPTLAPEPEEPSHHEPVFAAASPAASGWAHEPDEPREPHLGEAAHAAEGTTRRDAWNADTDTTAATPAATVGAAAGAAAAMAADTRTLSPEPFVAVPLDDGERHFAVTREKRAAQPGRVGLRIAGGLLAVVLFVLLLAQLAWWQRETVMVYWPASQPLFAQACAQLGCTVAPPRDIDGLQVEPPDLRQVDGPHRLELKMPLHNRFNVALAYPAIELTLLDSQNNVAIRRVLWPQDYVRPGTPIGAGLPAHTTQMMIVRLDIGNAVASNFRIQIFYP